MKKLLYILFIIVSFGGYAQSPGGITGAKLWLKANAGVTSAGGNGTTVSQWNDQSGNAYNVSQATGTYQPTYYTSTSTKLINYNPVIYFDGIDNFLKKTTALFPATSAYSFIGISTDESTNTGYNTLYACDDGANYWSFYKQNGATTDNGWNMWTAVTGPHDTNPGGVGFCSTGGANGYYNGTNYTSDANTQTTTPQISAITGTITNTVYPVTYIDGHSANYAAYTNTNSHYFQSFAIGSEVALAEPWKGRIPEFIAYNAKLTAAQMIRVNSYLAIKYGITLGQGGGTTTAQIFCNYSNYNYQASDATVIWDATTNSTYKYHIAGIGRDDGSGLDQEQSKSQNPGVQPIIGNASNINTSNATHVGSFSVDKSFELWGCDGASTSFGTAFAYGTCTYRMTRIWKVQETGTVGIIKLAMQVCDFPGSITEPYLIVSNTSTFDGTSTRIAMSKESIGGTYYYTGLVNFTNGQFFTFAGLLTSPGGIRTNLELWLKADGCVTSSGGDGTVVSTWYDDSGNGYDVTQTIGTYQPTYYNSTSSQLINYNPSVYFDGVDNFLKNTTPIFAATSPYSFIAAATDEATNTGYNTLYACDDAANYWSFYKQNGATTDNGWNMWTAVTGPHDTNPQGVGFSATGGPNGYYNGTNYTSDANTKTITPQISAITGTISNVLYPVTYIDGHSANYAAYTNTNSHYFQSFAIGSEVALAEPWKGRIPEFIAYSSKLTAAQMIKENTYLALKYGVTLGQGGGTTTAQIFTNNLNYDYQNTSGAVIWDATTNSGFKYNIAGIAKDRIEGLDQRISKSSNGVPDIVIISLDNNFTSANNDPTRTTTFDSDLSSLVWGTNNAATTFTQTYNTSLNFRMVRKWKMQQTNFTNQVYFKFTNANIANSTTYYLIGNTTGAETGWNQMSSATSAGAGNTVTFGPVSLGTKSYFSISNNPSTPLPIELLSFEASLDSKQVNISWETASETNNDYFTIERSIDGINFTSIATIPSKSIGGNSTSTLSYVLDDENITDNNVYYYRLKQTDFDGKFTYSNIDVVEVKADCDFTFKIAPNPNDGTELYSIIGSEKDQDVLIIVYDVYGNELYSKVILTQKGDVVYAIDLLQKLNSGIYFVTATSNKKILSRKLIVN